VLVCQKSIGKLDGPRASLPTPSCTQVLTGYSKLVRHGASRDECSQVRASLLGLQTAELDAPPEKLGEPARNPAAG
jgi:hypothetical protein